MRPISIIGLFCEDIREEKSGQDTLVGVLPDNIGVKNLPGALAKLGIYIRIQLDRDTDHQTIRTRIKIPERPNIEFASLDHLISDAQTQAEANGMPFAGLIAKGIVAPFQISALGKIEAIVEIDGTEYVCGALNVVQQLMATPSIASPPPA